MKFLPVFNSNSIFFIFLVYQTFLYIIIKEEIGNLLEKSKGIVYNYNLEGETLLTGNQLVQRLDKNLFESACRQIVFETFSGDLEKIFQFITENTVNNLSYPAVYSAYY